jgi:hypothetical protein
MFQLRDEHHQAFQTATMDAFERRAIVHVRTNFPEQSSNLSDDEIRARVRSGLVRARAYGFETERQGMRFIDTGFLLGPYFDTRQDTAWTQRVLNQPESSAEERARILLAEAQRFVNEPESFEVSGIGE